MKGQAFPDHGWKKLVVSALLVPLLLAAGQTARADVTERDLQVAARALSFMEPPLAGNQRLAIVYMPESTRSLRQAEALRDLLVAGDGVPNLRLEPELLPLDQIAEARVELFFLTEGLGEAAELLGRVAADAEIPCLTTDLEQVREGNCMMGVQSAPRVEILVNRRAAEASGISFANVFRMMIVEI